MEITSHGQAGMNPLAGGKDRKIERTHHEDVAIRDRACHAFQSAAFDGMGSALLTIIKAALPRSLLTYLLYFVQCS